MIMGLHNQSTFKFNCDGSDSFAVRDSPHSNNQDIDGHSSLIF